jgi:hypothetical protein
LNKFDEEEVNNSMVKCENNGLFSIVKNKGSNKKNPEIDIRLKLSSGIEQRPPNLKSSQILPLSFKTQNKNHLNIINDEIREIYDYIRPKTRKRTTQQILSSVNVNHVK